MTHLIDRIQALAGHQVAAAIQAEFGGQQVYLPNRAASITTASITSTAAKPIEQNAQPSTATSTDTCESGTTSTLSMATVPPATSSKPSQLRYTNFCLSAAMSLLMAALALMSIQSLIPVNTTASAAITGVSQLLLLLIQLCIAYPLLMTSAADHG